MSILLAISFLLALLTHPIHCSFSRLSLKDLDVWEKLSFKIFVSYRVNQSPVERNSTRVRKGIGIQPRSNHNRLGVARDGLFKLQQSKLIGRFSHDIVRLDGNCMSDCRVCVYGSRVHQLILVRILSCKIETSFRWFTSSRTILTGKEGHLCHHRFVSNSH